MATPKSFQQIISDIPEVSDCFRNGLQALGANASLVKVKSTRDFHGSVDLDGCSSLPTSKEFPKRWDYIFDYQHHILALEVHPADGDHNMKEVIEKAEWLRNWLKQNGSVLSVKGYYFVSTGPVRNSRSRVGLMLSQKGISLCGKILDLEKEMKIWK